MWTCQCGEQIEDQFDTCWKCARTDANAEELGLLQELQEHLAIECPHCKAALGYLGRKRFYAEGGLLTEIFLPTFFHREKYDVYVCSRCGHLEFFLAKIGEGLRRDDKAEDYSAPD